MNTKLTAMIQILIFLGAVTGRAEGVNLPEIESPDRIGRVQVFPSPKKRTWFLSLALSPKLDCAPGPTHKTCTLKVLNSLSAEEKKGLQELAASGKEVEGIWATDSIIEGEVREQFSGLPEAFAQSVPTLKRTLAMNDQFAYASIGKRLPRAEAVELEETFKSGGLGTFSSEVVIKAERTLLYLALSEPGKLRDLMQASLGGPGVTRETLRQFLIQRKKAGSLVAHGFDSPDEVIPVALQYLSTVYFKNQASRRYRALESKLPAADGVAVLFEESFAPIPLHCKVTLVLKQGAQSDVQCEEGADS